MDISDFFCLGKVVKTHGLDGELSGFIDSDDPLSYSIITSVFFSLPQGMIPFPLKMIDCQDNGQCIFKLKGIDNIEQARRFANKPMFLPLSMLPKLTGKNFYFHEIIGYKVVDQNKMVIGTVKGVMEHQIQPILEILHQGVDVLVPIHDDLLISVDREEKELHIIIPEGLLDLYLNT